MRIDILTLFPEMFASLKESILGRAIENGAFELNLIQFYLKIDTMILMS